MEPRELVPPELDGSDERLQEHVHPFDHIAVDDVREDVHQHIEDLADALIGEAALREAREAGDPGTPLDDIEWPS